MGVRRADLLFELGCEELPARFLNELAEQLEQALVTMLDETGIAHGDSQRFATPRRLAVLIEQVETRQSVMTKEVRGPSLRIAQDAKGAWSQAALGFARKQGVRPTALVTKTVGEEKYIFATTKQGGNHTKDVLAEQVPQVLQDLSLPSSMRFGISGARFVRPVRWLVLLHGHEVIPCTWADLQAGRTTRGHRSLGRVIELQGPESYVQQLREEYVLADRGERREQILLQLQQLEEQEGFSIDPTPELLDEVTDLLEFPTAFVGSLPEDSLDLPEAVLLATLRDQQRYFPVRDPEGGLLPLFVAVRNGNDQHIETVAQGNEQVIAARLADAHFFYQADQKRSLQEFIQNLDTMVYHETIGSMGQRVQRLHALARSMGKRVGCDATELRFLERAAELAKFDLASMMVGEFPKLEGFIGAHYAQRVGEPSVVTKAIDEHLLPRFAGDVMPSSKLGTLLSLADKFEVIVTAFVAGIRPTGSQDPHGLRRRAQAIVATLCEPEWTELSISAIWGEVLDLLDEEELVAGSPEEIVDHLREFFELRIISLLDQQDLPPDVCDALLAGSLDVPYLVLQKAEALEGIRQRPSFRSEVEAYTRVAKLAQRAEPTGEVYPPSLRAAAEIELYRTLQKVEGEMIRAQEARDAEQMYEALQPLTPAIHRFFDEVLVMVEDKQVRANRLVLLRSVRDCIRSFADLSCLHLPAREERFVEETEEPDGAEEEEMESSAAKE